MNRPFKEYNTGKGKCYFLTLNSAVLNLNNNYFLLLITSNKE